MLRPQERRAREGMVAGELLWSLTIRVRSLIASGIEVRCCPLRQQLVQLLIPVPTQA